MSPTVLVVDDSRTIRQVVEMALKASPFDVVGAASAREGVQAAERMPSVILLDYHMPDASGYDVCRSLKGNSSTAHIPIIMLGGNARNFSETDARGSGADEVVMKPFLTDTLVSAIDRLANSAGAPASAGSASAPPAAPPARPTPPKAPPQRESGSHPQMRPGASQPRIPNAANPGRAGGSQPRIATPDVNASTRAHDVAAGAPSATPGTTNDSGVSNIGMSRAEIETLVKEEVQRSVKEQLPGLLRNVMGEVFQKKVLPKLLEHGEQRVDAIVETRLNEKISGVVRAEIERLLAEE
jgi:CheY-like chemotaxis protein